jgi:hypothetical protein
VLRVRGFNTAHHDQGGSSDSCEFPHDNLLSTRPRLSA